MDFNSKILNIKKNLDQLNPDNFKKQYLAFLKRLPDISHLKNVVLFTAIAAVLVLTTFPQRFSALYGYLPKNPLPGGTYKEGVVGKIEQFNPLYSVTNSAEQSATKLIFSGLTKRDGSRKVVGDLAEKWVVSGDGREYVFTIKEGAKWQDSAPLTADDVVFTVNSIQNPDTRSPYLDVWKNVQVQKVDARTVKFILPNAYASFLNITDFSILPQHLLEKVPARNLKTAEFSLKPIGSGPFKLVEIKEIRESQEITLEPSEHYYGNKPYLSKFILKTYPDSRSLLDGYVKKEVKGMERIPVISNNEERKLPSVNIYELAIPNYDVMYFNLRRGATKEKALRQAIALTVDRSEILKEVYLGRGEKIYSSILPGYSGYNPKLKVEKNLNEAKKVLVAAGYSYGPDGMLKKGDQAITLSLVTSDEEFIKKEADLLAVDMGLLGIKVKAEKYPVGALVQNKIRPREFDILLISQNLGVDSDLYPFWHGTQVNDPGLNFSGFSDRRTDKLLEQGRSLTDPTQRGEKYKAAVEIIYPEYPAVYLVRPSYRYGVSSEVKGVSGGKLFDPSDRFWDVTEWYIKDERVK